MEKPILYSYWRSSCSWRVRIALNLKGIDYEYRAIHLVKNGGEQNKDDFRGVNSMCQVPTVDFGGGLRVSQSLAIIEYLDEKYPEQSPLMPADTEGRLKVRELSELINSGIQPLQNLSVMTSARTDPADRAEWCRYWIEKGFKAFESRLSETSGKFCVGDKITIADCCLIPQIYGAQRFKVDMDQFPNINRISKNLENIKEFADAHPDVQPDAQP